MTSAPSPTPMPGGYDRAIRPPLARMPPARLLRRTSPLSSLHNASDALPRLRSNASINDSSDDEEPIPVLSAEAEELLGVRTGDRPAGKGALTNGLQSIHSGEGSPIGKEDYKAKSILVREHTVSPAAYRPGSPRVVKLSGGSGGSGRLRRAFSVANVYEGSPLGNRGMQDMKTPAQRTKSLLGGSSSAGNSGASSGKPSSGESAPMGASTVYRTRNEDAGMHNSLRVKRIGKVSGSFLSGPARRGMIRRQSEEDQVPYVNDGYQAAADNDEVLGEKQGDEGANNQVRSSPPKDELMLPQRVRFAKGSTSPGQSEQREVRPSPYRYVQPRPLDNARNATNMSASKQTAAPPPATSAQLRPVFKISDLPPPLPSAYDQENAPPPTFKRDKPNHHILGHVDKSKQENHVSKAQLHSSPSRKPLAPRSHNTPMRPAPPPPKMSVLETATATAGAASVAHAKKKPRAVITVNGKQFTRMECIGRGGSGRVYRVMAENFKIFAIKCVSLEDLDELTIRGFKGEIELLRRLENVDRVVRLYDFEINEEKQVLRVLMDIGERDLKKVLEPKLDEETGKLNLPFTRYIWQEMLECVAAVHTHDIVHSDLKPPNFVMIHSQLKLIDFGIANAIQDDTVNVHREQQVGTPNYMSPETLVDTNAGRRASNLQSASHQQQRNAKLMKVGKPSDIWSLGCILYQIVYGKPPFGHISNNVRKVMAITDPNYAISFPSHGLGKVPVPTGLLRTLRKCLDRDPARRPTVEQLLSEGDIFLYPDNPGAVWVNQELIGRLQYNIIQHVQKHGIPSEEELRGWPARFFASIKQAVEDGRA